MRWNSGRCKNIIKMIQEYVFSLEMYVIKIEFTVLCIKLILLSMQQPHSLMALLMQSLKIDNSRFTELPVTVSSLASLNFAISVVETWARTLETNSCHIIFLIKYLSTVDRFFDETSLSYLWSKSLSEVLFASDKSTYWPTSIKRSVSRAQRCASCFDINVLLIGLWNDLLINPCHLPAFLRIVAIFSSVLCQDY